MYTFRRSRNRADLPRSRPGRRGLSSKSGVGVEALESRRLLATRTWSGAVDVNWNVAGNWVEGSVPVAGDDLVFPGAASNQSTSNNIPGVPTYRSIEVSGGTYSFSGGDLGLSDSLLFSAGSGTADFNLGIGLDSPFSAVLLDATGTGSLNLNGPVFSADNEGLDINSGALGTGNIGLAGGNSYLGATTLHRGLLTVTNAQALGSSGSGTNILSVGSLVLAGDGLTIAEPLTLDEAGAGGPGALIALGSNTLSGPIDLASDATVNVSSPDVSLNLNGAIGGVGGLTKTGPGALTLANAETYTGATSVTAGTLLVTGQNNATTGTTVSGSGQIGGTGLTTLVGVNSGSSLAPGLTIGIFSTLDLSFATGSTFFEEIAGMTIGTQYDSVSVAGTVDLDSDNGGGATLSVALLGGFSPQPGESFTIVDNDGSDPIAGTFNGLPEGATFSAGGSTFRISYVGGDGNDVVVTCFATTTSAVASSANPSTLGQAVTFTATVTASRGTATGNARLVIDGANIQTVGLDGSGQAAFNAISNLATGPHTVVVNYLGSFFYFASSGSLTGGQVVNQATTTTTVISPINPSYVGQSVTFTAMVAASNGPAPGTVELVVDGSMVQSLDLDESGNATFAPIGNFTAGTHSVVVNYLGNGSYLPSTGTLAGGQVVNQATSTIGVVSSRDPSIFGQPVTFTATATGSAGTPTGTVALLIDGLSVQTAALGLNGTATFAPITAMAAGTHTIDVSYAGESRYPAGLGTLAGGQVVLEVGTAVAVAAGMSNPVYGQPVLLFARVFAQAGTARGMVEFFDGKFSLGFGRLSADGQATLQTSRLGIGPRTITAAYLGDANFQASTAATPATTTVGKSTPQIAIAASSTSTVFGQNLYLRAWTAAPFGTTPTGTVSFFDGAGGIFLGSATLENGVATVKAPVLGLGTHTIRAVFNGNTLFNPVTSSIVSVTVSPAATALTVLPNPAQAVVGRPYQFRVAVRAASPGSGTPFGQVEVLLNGTRSAVIDLNASGQGSTFLTPTTAGSWTVGFRYLGSKYDTAGATPTTTTVQVLPASMMSPPPGGPMPLLTRGRTNRSS